MLAEVGGPVQHEEVTQGEVEVLRGVTAAAAMAAAGGMNPRARRPV